jgi:hypothetical protein
MGGHENTMVTEIKMATAPEKQILYDSTLLRYLD